jgi:hypothetical protein
MRPRAEKIAEAREMRAKHTTLDVIAERFGVSLATASRWTAGVLPPRPTVCRVEGCNEVPEARGYCCKHYTRFLRYGDATVTHKASEDEPLPPALKAYLAAFDQWLRDPGAENFLSRRQALGAMLERLPPPLDRTGRLGRQHSAGRRTQH